MAEQLVALAAGFGAQIVVNDRADIAKLADAHGVHVGQHDLAPDAVRRLIGGGRVIGLSTHSIAQLDHAVGQPIDYVAIGPVFETASKATGYDAIGLELVEQAAALAHARGLSLIAIGGITVDRALDVIRAGADSIAVISDLLSTGDPRARISQYLDRLTA